MDTSQCLFCGIVAGKIPAKKVYEDDHSIGFLDINPRNPGHTLVIPKKHAETLLDMSEKDAGKLFESVQKVAAMVKNGTNSQGLSIGQSNGQAAGQVVRHVHVHVIPRFANEGPVGLEGILPSKKIDDGSMDKIAMSIKSASRAHNPHREEPAKPDKKPKKTDEINFEF
jgi:histidine triad (HIT) family protein